MNVKSLSNRFVLFQVFFSLLIWVPVYFEAQVRSGLTTSEIFQIQSIYYIAFCLLEIPTGLFADTVGRRACMILGSIVLVAGNLVVVLAPAQNQYTGFLISFLLVALSRSLISGAASAYLYDQLAVLGRTDVYREVEGRARGWGLALKVLGWGSAGYLLDMGVWTPYALSALTAFLGGIVALSLWQESETKKAEGSSFPLPLEKLKRSFGTALALVAKSSKLKFLIVQGILIFVLARVAQVDVFQPVLKARGWKVSDFGWIMAGMSLFEAVGSFRPELAQRLFGLRGSRADNVVHIVSFQLAVTAALIPFLGGYSVVALFWLGSLTMGIGFPAQKALIQGEISDSGVRATVLSIESIVDRAVCAFVAYILSLAMQEGGIGLDRYLWLVGVVSVGIATSVLFWGRWLTKALTDQ